MGPPAAARIHTGTPVARVADGAPRKAARVIGILPDGWAALDATFGGALEGFPSDLSVVVPVKGTKLLQDESGNQYALTRGRSTGHAAEQLRADRLYRILGVRVPASRAYPDRDHPGQVVKLARVIPGAQDLETALADPSLAPLVRERAQSELATHALLEHWRAYSGDEIRIRPGPSPESWMVKTPGALRFRVRGEPKPSGFDPYPMSLWTMRDGTNPASARIFGGLKWGEIAKQLDAIAGKREQLLSAVADDPALQATLSARLDTIDFLRKATRALQKEGMAEDEIDRTLKDVLVKEAGGAPRPTIKSLVPKRVVIERPKAPAATTSGDPLARLNETQKSALALARSHAALLSGNALPRLQRIVTGNGFSEAELQRVLDYVRDEAPLHVYFNSNRMLPRGPSVLESFLMDGQYKNQFETRVSGGTLAPTAGGSRDGWEQINFRGAYHTHALIPSERPKYGVLNAEGLTVRGASQYGASILVLKPEVKLRSTFTPADSGHPDASLVATPEHAAHALAETAGLKLILQHVLGRPLGAPGHRYTEAQVHGPLELDKDVAQIIAPDAERYTLKDKYRALSRKYNVPLFWNDGRRFVSD